MQDAQFMVINNGPVVLVLLYHGLDGVGIVEALEGVPKSFALELAHPAERVQVRRDIGAACGSKVHDVGVSGSTIHAALPLRLARGHERFAAGAEVDHARLDVGPLDPIAHVNNVIVGGAVGRATAVLHFE